MKNDTFDSAWEHQGDAWDLERVQEQLSKTPMRNGVIYGKPPVMWFSPVCTPINWQIPGKARRAEWE